MRPRTGDWWTAGVKRAIERGGRSDPRADDATKWAPDFIAQLNDPTFEAAQDGDVWRVVWTGEDSWRSGVGPDEGPLAGYVLTCPAPNCEEGVHLWVLASNCECRDKDTGKCCHAGVGTCWTWTGTPEEGNLTASPSLFARGAKCEWHGWLRDGVMQT